MVVDKAVADKAPSHEKLQVPKSDAPKVKNKQPYKSREAAPNRIRDSLDLFRGIIISILIIHIHITITIVIVPCMSNYMLETHADAASMSQ